MSTPVDYKDIPGFDGYRAGSNGSIWSNKSGEWKRKSASIKISNGISYFRVILCRPGINGKTQKIVEFVHRLVLLAFSGPAPDGLMCRHLDGDSLNNHRDNLKWGTSKENAADTTRHGRREPSIMQGQKNGRAKLSDQNVVSIRDRHLAGESTEKLAAAFGVHKKTVYDIVKGRHWSHLVA